MTGRGTPRARVSGALPTAGTTWLAGDAQADQQRGGQGADDDDELEPADCLADVGEAGGDDQGAPGLVDDPQPELGVPAGAGHGLGVLADGGKGQAGREPGLQANFGALLRRAEILLQLPAAGILRASRGRAGGGRQIGYRVRVFGR
jgi:hypothetical protein